MDEVEEIFQIYDDDHSGTLDEEEFVFAMSETGTVDEQKP
jgi:Ca2+-binding EF-hand superfamily protein